MASVHKIFQSGVIIYQANIIFWKKVFVKGMSSVGACGGNDGKKDGTGQDDKNKPCPVCRKSPCSACVPPLYDCRKYGPNLPQNTQRPCFDMIPNVPTDIFRCTSGETLGPGGNANKCGCYPNPEYYSFHHMSYYDMHLILRCNRLPRLQTNRKP